MAPGLAEIDAQKTGLQTNTHAVCRPVCNPHPERLVAWEPTGAGSLRSVCGNRLQPRLVAANAGFGEFASCLVQLVLLAEMLVQPLAQIVEYLLAVGFVGRSWRP